MVKNPYIILQARMNSERLPGKVMKTVGGIPLIGVLLERIKGAEIPILLATSANKENDELVEYALNNCIEVFRGSEFNLLERYYLSAKSVKADLIFRLTGDNPFIESNLIREVLNYYLKNCNNRSYISTGLSESFPLGISVEAFSYELLEEALINAVAPGEYEHVTPYMHQNKPGDVEIVKFGSSLNRYHYRLTVDTSEDFELIRRLIEEHGCSSKTIHEIVNILDNNPELVKINKEIVQKGWD